MFGCLRTVGCLTVVAVLVVAGIVTRDRWLPALTGGARAVSTATFDPLTAERRERGRQQLEALGRKSGPVFTNLTAAEASALVLADRAQRLPAFAEKVEAAVVGDRLVLRTTLDPAALKGIDALGPVARMLQSRQRVLLEGTLEVAAPGRALFIVQDVRVNEFAVPSPAIASLVRQLDRGAVAPGDPARAIGFAIPPYVGDVRVGKGRVTLYKAVS
ncbi:MAG: hypothetical protein ABS52_09675 [Gemmatimonadetes bacterium SCN 70-22]|nr:MAG: hypothetical protein ABS52_09675 [Gemmatimonadetes bacterium SCN 70-22]